MPATEQTWRDQKLMHKVFGASCFVLLLSTIWMFVADHDREWKMYQDTARGVDLQMTNWQKLQFQTDEWIAKHEELQAALASVEGQDIPQSLLDAFKALLPEHNFSRVDGLAAGLHDAAKEAATKRSNNENTGYHQLQFDHDATKVAVENAQRDAQDFAKAADEAEAKIASAPNADEAKAAAEDAWAKANAAVEDLEKAIENEAKAKSEVERAKDELIAAESNVANKRRYVLNALNKIIADARYQEDAALKNRKFRSADLDAAKANLGLAVRDSLSAEAQNDLQSIVDKVTSDVVVLNTAYEQAADLRTKLQNIVKEMTRDEDEEIEKLQKDESLNLAKLDGLNRTIKSRRSNFFEFYGVVPVPGKRWLEMPILDAFNSPRKIDNLWSDGLVQDFNFSKVRRFDRCSTCHKSIDKTAPGSADQPAYVHDRLLTFTVPAANHDDFNTDNEQDSYAMQVYGMRLALEGLVQKNDVTVSFVQPKSIAARASLREAESRHDEQSVEDLRMALLRAAEHRDDEASQEPEQGLMLGDVIVAVNGDDVRGREQTVYRLRQLAEDGESFSLTVQRGLPNPYISHPRLDLFVGSLSPHKMSDFACTICHDGQGSGTEFKWVSHMPDSEKQRKEWSREHGWFDNHHWIYPMYPKRFAESLCLKCHHEVVELEPSEKFPDPPAPKLMHGYNLIRKYGCYGCHEINGYDGPKKRIGPDLRMEPNYFSAAQQFKGMPDSGYDNLSDRGKELVAEVTHHPDRNGARRELLQIILDDGDAEDPQFSGAVHSTIASLLKDSESPGKLRRPGPSLRFVGEKLDGQFMFDWIREPKHFRSTTRMPQFFGLWEHMEGDEKSLSVAKEYEPIEILGIITYLRDRSQEFEPLDPPEGITESSAEEKVSRGKLLFQERGCLACHTHNDFQDAAKYRGPDEIVQGPDLSAVGNKFATDRNPMGAKWLYSWIKQPTRYHVRTVMPDLFLDPIDHKDADGNVTVTDPVADIVAYLLTGVDSKWKPADGYSDELSDEQRSSLDKMVMEHLRDSFYEETAKKYLDFGIPESVRDQVKVAEHEMIVPDGSFKDSVKITESQKLVYVGRKTLTKYGCFGCHDVPGFEDAKPIGTGLADWGRKEPAKLAFEHIAQYLHHKQEHAEHANGHENEHENGHDDHDVDLPSDYYMHQIHGGHRQGFIYQKLAEPRSYDYHKTLNKKYNERLRMPQFPFDTGEREAVITFVLGLVSDPPTEKYVYKPSPRDEAIIAGRRVIEKYNCGGCHIMEGEKWNISYSAGHYGEQNVKPGFPFVFSQFTPAQLAESAESDRRNLLHATLTGVPAIGDDGKPVVYDDEGDPVQLSGEDATFDPTTVEYGFDLWKPTVIDGSPYQVGELSLIVPASQIDSRYESNGGFLTNYLLPHAVAREKLVNPNAKGSEARGWLPPPLVGEGRKVQSNWLYEFLLDPHPIRPAVLLRMPRFNLSAAEATDLVNYFSAMDNSQFPFEFAGRRRSEHLTAAAREYGEKLAAAGEAVDNGSLRRFDDAMKIVTDNNYCVKCHLVGDFVPGGADRAKAPNLAEVYERMRPDYVRKWIAKPTGFLPYTSMPVNVPYDATKEHLGGVKQDLYHGTSVEQVDALVDLLMNFDVYAKQRSLIAPLVKPPPAEGAETPAAGDSASE